MRRKTCKRKMKIASVLQTMLPLLLLFFLSRTLSAEIPDASDCLKTDTLLLFQHSSQQITVPEDLEGTIPINRSRRNLGDDDFVDCPALRVKAFTLNNGLTVWINEDPNQSKLHGVVVVHAGGKDSPDTGIAHYLEHLLFKGTEKIGTVDYEAEKPLLDLIEAQYEKLSQTTDAKARAEIQREINRLSVAASEYVIPNEFDQLISRYGGSKLNAFTSYDITAYHNSFPPHYFRQWAAINSERLINPVFRMFQSELETVYEEKNMYADAHFSVVERFMDRFFKPHPYRYPILGSTENLKNPHLPEMRKFFETYYVAGNMALILSGNVHAEEVLPIIEETFGRLPAGEAPQQTSLPPTPFVGRERFPLKVPLPLVKVVAPIWRGVPGNHEDEGCLTLALLLLSNANKTGFLDKLMVDREVMMAGIATQSMDEAGMIIGFVIPKLLFHSKRKATDLFFGQIDRLKQGDFTDEALQNVKNELKRSLAQELEEPTSRYHLLMSAFSQGKSWEEILRQHQTIDRYTKEDIVRVVNRYLTENYLEVVKKTGRYPKELLKKPGFDPILPKQRDAVSAYAQSLAQWPIPSVQPRMIDFEKDVQTVTLSPFVTLYLNDNPLNGVFSLKIIHDRGEETSRLLQPLSAYLGLLGTDSLSFDAFHQQLQAKGATMNFSTSPTTFELEVRGLDERFEETMVLVHHFMGRVKEDQRKIKQLIDLKRLENKSANVTPTNLAEMMAEKVLYGEQSHYLNRLSYAEMKRLTSHELLAAFEEVQKVACSIHYCGKLPAEKVTASVESLIDVSGVTLPSVRLSERTMEAYHEPLVFFLHQPKVTQTIIQVYMKGQQDETDHGRHVAPLFSSYFGRGMGSLTFQEIREFRSLAYYVSAGYHLHPFKQRARPGYFFGSLSTQSDKTVEAVTLLDSLIRDMPIRPERLAAARQAVVNKIFDGYPSFRHRSEVIEQLKCHGHRADPNASLVTAVGEMTMEDVVAFYQQQLKGGPLVYLVVGDKKKIDRNELSKLGKIVKVSVRELYR